MLTQDDPALFFNQPRANAEFDLWSKLAKWTLDQAIALSLGKHPPVVNWDDLSGKGKRSLLVAEFHSHFRKEYAQRRTLVASAKSAHLLTDPIKPDRFLAWAKRMELSVPPELETCVAKYWPTVDWQARCRELDQRVAELESEAASRLANKWPWGIHETALLRILAIAAAKWEGYDPDKANNPKNAEIVALVRTQLREQGLRDSNNMAKAIATIVRAKNVPYGPKQRPKQPPRKRNG